LRQEYRYAHSVRVARTADRLAQAHGIDPRQARCAGMLHDIARLWPVDRFEEEHPIVLHARIGALLAEERFGVTDRAVLSAITKHTVADPVMTPLDAIIFVADATEPGRQFALRAEILEVALRDLETGLAAVYTSTRESLERHGLPPSPALLTVPRLTK